MKNTDQISVLLGKRILYVNDCPLLLSQMQRKLSKTGVKLLQATSPKEAFAIARKNIDLAIVNMNLSSSNAHKTTRELKINQPDLIVLAESSCTQEELIETLIKQLQSSLN